MPRRASVPLASLSRLTSEGISGNTGLRHSPKFLLACSGGPDTFTLLHHRLPLSQCFSMKYLGLPYEKRGVHPPCDEEGEGSNFIFFGWADGTLVETATRRAISLNRVGEKFAGTSRPDAVGIGSGCDVLGVCDVSCDVTLASMPLHVGV
jgi:hypothetical protein